MNRFLYGSTIGASESGYSVSFYSAPGIHNMNDQWDNRSNSAWPEAVNDNFSLYVTNGLVYYVDSGKTGSYPGTPYPNPYIYDLSPYNNTTTLSCNILSFDGVGAGNPFYLNIGSQLLSAAGQVSSMYGGATRCTTLSSTYGSKLSTMSAFTVSVWANPPAGDNNYMFDCNYFLTGRFGNQGNDRTGPILAGGRYWTCLAGPIYTTYTLQSSSSRPPGGKWVNLVMVRDPSGLTLSGAQYAYYNAYPNVANVPASAVNTLGGHVLDTGIYGTFGKSGFNFITLGYGWNTNQPYGGTIAVFQIWNRALSASEIAQNYNAFAPRFGLAPAIPYTTNVPLTALSGTGTITIKQGFQQIDFTSSGYFTLCASGNLNYFSVAGGGGGGGTEQDGALRACGGGGGAGGYYTGSIFLTAGTYSVVIGGGAPGSTYNPSNSSQGNSTYITRTGYNKILTVGGGTGGQEGYFTSGPFAYSRTYPGYGASGGGSGMNIDRSDLTYTGGASIAPGLNLGYPGGAASVTNSQNLYYGGGACGGGGGSGGPGGDGYTPGESVQSYDQYGNPLYSPTISPAYGGNGGGPANTVWTPVLSAFVPPAGGGGGCAYNPNNTWQTNSVPGAGGSSSAGQGSDLRLVVNPYYPGSGAGYVIHNATANSGSGGGGASSIGYPFAPSGGNGGSGRIVIWTT